MNKSHRSYSGYKNYRNYSSYRHHKNKKVRRLFTVLCCAICLSGFGQKAISDTSRLRDGDLLFLVAPETNAITAVTSGTQSLPIDHVGIFHHHDGKGMVLEATYNGVVETPLADFGKGAAKVLVGRVRGKIDMVESLANAHALLGRPYDFLFLPENEEIYCSELVQLSFVFKDGSKVFAPIPMTFRDNNGDLLPYWQEFYARRLSVVPDGFPGSNPGELSRRQNVRIKYELRGIAR